MTFVINASYDASVTSLATSNPTLYAHYVGATQAAINYLEGVITNSITLTMSFGYGEAGGQTLPSNALGENASFYAQVSGRPACGRHLITRHRSHRGRR